MFDAIMNFIVDIIFWGILILCGIGWLIVLPFGGKGKANTKNKYNKIKSKKSYQTSKNKKNSSRLPGVHEDYDEKIQKELIKEGKYESYNFEEEDLEEDDYHYEDEK